MMVLPQAWDLLPSQASLGHVHCYTQLCPFAPVLLYMYSSWRGAHVGDELDLQGDESAAMMTTAGVLNCWSNYFAQCPLSRFPIHINEAAVGCLPCIR